MSTIDLYDGEGFVDQVQLPASLPAGQFKFRLGKVRRQGGNGVVVEAQKQSYGGNNLGTCAVKFLKRVDSSRADRFRNEARVLRECSHPHISKYLADGEERIGSHVVPWIAMELGGENLRRHVEEKGPLRQDALGIVATQATSAIAHLHAKGFVHRDIKPENFVWDLTVDGTIQMIDFGLAKRQGEDVSARPLDQFTKQLEFVGPVFFSSPELIAYATDKTHPVDHRSDLFQLGKTLWFLGTGRISAGCPNAKHCPLGGRLHHLVVNLLDDDPEARYENAEIVRTQLNQVFSPEG